MHAILQLSLQGLNPVEEIKLQRRFKRIFREEQPDAIPFKTYLLQQEHLYMPKTVFS